MSQEIKYKFENLQPINFLKRFNKMVDDDSKHSLRKNKKELKIFPLSRFPLPQFYEKMEGIFETGTKKKDIATVNLKNKDDIQDEQFFEKHRTFMAKHIKKIILENESYQQNLQIQKQHEQSKKSLQHQIKGVSRARSQPKFHKGQKAKIIKTNNDTNYHDNRSSQENIKIYNNQNVEDQDSVDEEKNYTYLQKIQKDRFDSFRNTQKQKIKIKNKKQVKEFLETRKGFLSQKKKQENHKFNTPQYDIMSPQDKKKAFISKLLALQQEQNGYQRKFDRKVEQQILGFNKTIQESIKAVKVQKFW